MSDDLDLLVDRTSDVPLGTQLLWKLRTRIATGELVAGARLPGIRDLAGLAGVNLNTVRTVLARLEEQGLIITHQGRGNFVAENAQPNAQLTHATEAAAAEASAAGVDPRELAQALYAGRRDPSATTGAGDESRDERQTLRHQIARLERELAEMEPLRPLQETLSTPRPRVLTTSELREVRDELAARVEQTRREQQHWRYEKDRALAAQRASEAASRDRRWTSGVWTGGRRADVSWRAT